METKGYLVADLLNRGSKILNLGSLMQGASTWSQQCDMLVTCCGDFGFLSHEFVSTKMLVVGNHANDESMRGDQAVGSFLGW